MSPSGIVSKWSNYMSLALNLRLYQCWKSLYRSIWSFRDHHFRKMDGTSLNFTVMFHAIFPFSIHSEFDFRWSPGGGQIGQALARGSRGVLFVAQMDVCKDINEAQRARSSSIWVTWKSWENLGKMVGKMLEICEDMLGKYGGKTDVWQAHFPTTIVRYLLWTSLDPVYHLGHHGKWWDGPVNKSDPQLWWIRSYSFTVLLSFYYSFMLCFTHFPHWNRLIFKNCFSRLSRGRATPCGWAETGKQWLNTHNMGMTRCMA